MRKGSAVISLLLIGLGVFAFIQTFNFPASFNPHDPGPAYFPRMLSILLIILSVGIIISKWEESKDKMFQELPLLGKTVLLAAAYFIAVYLSGFYLPTTVFTLCFFKLLRVKKWSAALGYSIGLSVIIYLVFTELLAMPLPVGIITGTV